MQIVIIVLGLSLELTPPLCKVLASATNKSPGLRSG